MDYNTYISSPEWAVKREARLSIDGHRCRLCDEDGTRYRLEAHHRPSSYARIPNESVQDDLLTVCARCHEPITDAIRSDRYGRRDPPTATEIATKIELRNEVTHDLATFDLSVHIVRPVADALRADCRPAEQVQQTLEANLWQEDKDRRRP